MFDVDGWLRSTEEEKEAGEGRACCQNWVTSLFDVYQTFRLCHSGQFRLLSEAVNFKEGNQSVSCSGLVQAQTTR